MKTANYILKINGLTVPRGTISILALKELIDILVESSEKALRLSVEGTSSKKGQLPAWLRNSVDYTITGLRKGSTKILISAPELIETAQEELMQPDLWNILPKQDDTALSILIRAANDAINKNNESSYLDSSLLSSLLSFDNFIGSYAKSFELFSENGRSEKIKIESKQIENIREFKKKIPEQQKVILSGLFNEIEHTEGKFRLKLNDGTTITGEIDREFIDKERMRSLWGKTATVRGIAEFKPNKYIRYIKADLIKQYEERESILLNNTSQEEPLLLFERVQPLKQLTNPLKELWGAWPGDESIEELLKELED